MTPMETLQVMILLHGGFSKNYEGGIKQKDYPIVHYPTREKNKYEK